MNIRRVIERLIRLQDRSLKAAGDVSGVISANVGMGSSHSRVSARGRQRVVQRSAWTRDAGNGEPRERGANTMEPEETGVQTEPADEDRRGRDSEPEPKTPPIDEDMAGSVNAALPEADE